MINLQFHHDITYFSSFWGWCLIQNMIQTPTCPDKNSSWYNGWWLAYPSEKYESQWEGLSHNYIFRPMVTGWHDPVDTTRYLHAEHGISHVLHQDLRDELQTLHGLARALTCFYRIHLKQSSQISYVRKVLGCGLTNLCKPDIPSDKLT